MEAFLIHVVNYNNQPYIISDNTFGEYHFDVVWLLSSVNWWNNSRILLMPVTNGEVQRGPRPCTHQRKKRASTSITDACEDAVLLTTILLLMVNCFVCWCEISVTVEIYYLPRHRHGRSAFSLGSCPCISTPRVDFCVFCTPSHSIYLTFSCRWVPIWVKGPW